MGRAEREREEQERIRRERRWVWLKAFVAFILVYPLIPFAFAVSSYRENKWPWQGWDEL
jgi:hypothetical protein